ncbi:hypothetical protein XH96_36915 [Bradyrhizobium sp. CCBAU 51765]|nr:hypothetical protein XH96_36915 [Bradyrhizobium sp. CCBAU 51765]
MTRRTSSGKARKSSFDDPIQTTGFCWRIAVDQQIAESDDLPYVGHSAGDFRRLLRQSVQRLSNCRSTAERINGLAR